MSVKACRVIKTINFKLQVYITLANTPSHDIACFPLIIMQYKVIRYRCVQLKNEVDMDNPLVINKKN